MKAYFLAAALVVAAAASCAVSAPKSVTGIPTGVAIATPPEAVAEDAGAAFPADALPALEPLPDAEVTVAKVGDAASSKAPAESVSACNEQPPQPFLIRGNFLKDGRAGNQRAIQYRTDEYGYFKGFGHPAPGASPPSASVVDTTFFGLHVKMHKKVAPALACVEEEIRRSCEDRPYTPHALAGIRFRNTYRGGEVTNHAYGIAIDVDPSINTCCGCVPPWNDAPACKRPTKSEYGHMAMPECWVHAFERYGFYWLGHDVLKDTMHFEFLGDPSRIVRTEATTEKSD